MNEKSVKNSNNDIFLSKKLPGTNFTMIMKYWVKPFPVQVVLWTGVNFKEVAKFCGDSVIIIKKVRTNKIEVILNSYKNGPEEVDVGNFIVKNEDSILIQTNKETLHESYSFSVESVPLLGDLMKRRKEELLQKLLAKELVEEANLLHEIIGAEEEMGRMST